MKKRLKWFFLFIVVFIAGLFIYSLLWGKLFPYSPVILGFDKHELPHTIIYVQQGAGFKDFIRIDTLTTAVEKFHELKFIRKPKVFIFRDRDSYLQRSPSKARFCTFSSGSLIISPWALKEAEEGKISLEIYLRHELSHILIFDYNGFLSEFRYPKWLLEGIATYSSNQMGTSFYPGKLETYQLMKQGNFIPPQFYGTKREDEVKLNVKYKEAFKYSEFACIVDYLICTYGREQFIKYMKLLFAESDNNTAFKSIYKKSFDEVISDFRKQL